MVNKIVSGQFKYVNASFDIDIYNKGINEINHTQLVKIQYLMWMERLLVK